MLILPKLRKGKKLEHCNSDFVGGSQFTSGVNKRNSTRGMCLGLVFASPQLVWRKTTVFLGKQDTSRRAWEKGEVGLEVCLALEAVCHLKEKVWSEGGKRHHTC